MKPGSTKKRKRIAAPGDWATIQRAFVVTLGAVFCAVAIMALLRAMHPEQTSSDTWIAAAVMGVGGLILLTSGLLGSPKYIKTLTQHANHPWQIVFIWILAFPVHLLMTMFDRKR